MLSFQAAAGGGGVLQTDRCVLQMGFFKTHLTIYQPQTRASEKFCDAVPDTANTVFVLDYLHDSLNKAPIEFRIIEDATGLGEFARWQDVQALDDIEQLTVAYQPPRKSAGGSFQMEHAFKATGDYLVLVTVGHPNKDKVYRAVAPLTVGGSNWLYWLIPPAAAGFGLVAVGYWLRRRG